MNKPRQKLQVIDLNLGIDPQEITKKPEITPSTIEKANRIIAFDAQEHAALQRIREQKAKEEQAKEDGIERVYKALIAAATEQKGVLATELIAIAGSADLSSVILRLRNYAKKRGDLWQITKHRENKQTVYRMEPTKKEDSDAV